MADLAGPQGPDVPPLVQAVLYHRDPLGVLRRARAAHGPVFTLRFPSKQPLVCVCERGAVEELLKADPARAHAGEARRSVLPQASPRSPFGADGDAHASTRARMAAGFSPERMAALEPDIAALADRHVAAWPRNRPFRLLPRMRTLATDVFVRTVLAVRDEARAAALVAAIRRLLWTPGNPPLPVPGPGDGMLGRVVDKRFADRRAPVARLLAEEIAERRHGRGGEDDVLGGVVAAEPGADPDVLVDELLVVLMAAQEPPSIALTNVLLELASRPDLAAQFAADDAGALRASVIGEALRLRPAAQAVLRKLTGPMGIAGHRLAGGTLVAIPSLLVHRDPESFPEPDAFHLERASDGAPFIPFGGGARRCIGEHLAHAEFRAALPAITRRLRLHAASPRPERMLVRGTVLVPHLSALVTARPAPG